MDVEASTLAANAEATAATAGAAVAETIAAVTEEAARQVENAEARVETAEAVSQAVSDAAMLTTLGQQVEGCKSEVAQCLTKMTTLEMDLAGLKNQMMEIATRPLAAVAVSPDNPLSSIPPNTEKTVEEISTETITPVPAAPGNNAENEAAPQGPAKRRRQVIR